MKSSRHIVPTQRKGAKSDTHYSVRASDEQHAKQLFQNARINLLNVNSWHTLAGSGGIFQLVNEKGEEINALAERGNYFRIDIPVIPGSEEGKGSEWVRVEMIEEESKKYLEYTAMRVRPSAPPFADETETAHFFSDSATSSFCVIRKNKRVTASVVGRNEKPNLETDNLTSRLRNIIVAIGAMIGFNKPQWKDLTRGIIKKKGAVLRV